MPEFDSTVEFRDVKEFPGYKASNTGEIWSCRPKNGIGPLRKTWRKLKPKRNGSGHYVVMLCPSRTTLFIHRLVLETFVGRCPDGMECRHFPDGDKANNNLNNLQWGTKKENHADAIVHESYGKDVRSSRAKMTPDLVRVVRTEHACGVLNCKEIAKKHGITHMMVWQAVVRRTWKHIA